MERGFFFCQNGVSACVRERNGRKRKKVLWEMTKSRDFGTCKEEEGETARQTVRLPIAEIFKRQKHFFSSYPIFAFLGSKKRWKRWHKNSANSDAISFPPFFPRLSKRERNGGGGVIGHPRRSKERISGEEEEGF